MNEIMESLYQRKSMRAYEDREIPEEMKKLILKFHPCYFLFVE